VSWLVFSVSICCLFWLSVLCSFRHVLSAFLRWGAHKAGFITLIDWMITRVMFDRCTLTAAGTLFYRSAFYGTFPSGQKGYPFNRTVLSHLSFKRWCGLWNRDEALCYSQSKSFAAKIWPPFKILDFQENTGLFISPWNILKIRNK